MSTTSTPNLGLALPVPGTSEPFELGGEKGINTNFTKIDTAAGVATAAIAAEAVTRAAADVALDGRLDVLEARPKVYVQAADPTSGMVSGDLRFW